eukprot:TRINITY_DN2944_c0_g1_i1.p1 TRINITY_DN2944_c0_g1~~TRINITY_DN2944_c0_g1_i1.p1  ORF type:complete len:429 (+),score=111.04 TRINITY_DN2944_c0_g1_i1:145-1431(+)
MDDPSAKDNERNITNSPWFIEPEKLTLGPEIGRGSFGIVHKSEYLGSQVCIKEIFNSASGIGPDQESLKKEFEHEVKILKALRHPNVVLFMGISEIPLEEGKKKFLIVQEFVKGGSLLRFLQKNKDQLNWMHRISMAHQISQAMTYLHERKLLHRDLKAENVLIEDGTDSILDFKCKVADFGLATLFKQAKGLEDVGTLWWRAPEVSTGKYDLKADVFSFGIVLLELITNETGDSIRISMTESKKDPVTKEYVFNVVPQLVREEFVKQVEWCPVEFLDLALRCCDPSPDTRPSMAECAEILTQLDEQVRNVVQVSKKKIEHPIGIQFWLPLLFKFFKTGSEVQVPIDFLFDELSKSLLAQSERVLTEGDKEFLLQCFPGIKKRKGWIGLFHQLLGLVQAHVGRHLTPTGVAILESEFHSWLCQQRESS